MTGGRAAVAGVALLAACAGRDATGERRARLPEPTGTCIFINTIADWKAVDSSTLRVRTRARGWQYEIELVRRCPDIRFAEAAVWQGSGNRICDYRNDAILVRQDRCAIGAIRRLAEPTPTPAQEQ